MLLGLGMGLICTPGMCSGTLSAPLEFVQNAEINRISHHLLLFGIAGQEPVVESERQPSLNNLATYVPQGPQPELRPCGRHSMLVRSGHERLLKDLVGFIRESKKLGMRVPVFPR